MPTRPNSDKPSVIRQMLRHIGKIEFLLRVCNDQRLITPRVWASAIELLQSIGSQGGGWANYSSAQRRQLHEGRCPCPRAS